MQRVVGARKQARLEKVVVLAAEKRVVTNDDVQKLLRVSDATATRYLNELVRQGRLKRSGVRAGTRCEST
jgi:DeoR/GlpR family transcriptional regulator of sugar metabolism